MGSQLKPGGLAIIISSVIPENLGREVETVACLGFGTKFRFNNIEFEVSRPLEAWHVCPTNGQPLFDGDGDPQPELPFPAENLMPIDKDQNPDTSEHRQRTREKEHTS